MAEAPGLPDLSARRSRLLGGDRRGLILSTTSTVVVLAVLLAIFLLAPGSRQVRTTFFNPADMWRAFVGNPKAGYYSIGEALWLNIRMFVVAEIGILILALVVAMIRQSTGPVLLPLRVVSTVYVDVARGVPLVLVIFPPLLNDFISPQKDTALVGLLGSIEANKAAELFSDTTFNYSSYTVAAILFLLLTIPLARFTDRLIARDQARRLAGARLWTRRATALPRGRRPQAQKRPRHCGSSGCGSPTAPRRCCAASTWR